jgi:hypothetical protein
MKECKTESVESKKQEVIPYPLKLLTCLIYIYM